MPNYSQQLTNPRKKSNMEHNNNHFESVLLAARRICASMARADTDTSGVRFAKNVFRFAAPTTGAAVVAVYVLDANAN